MKSIILWFSIAAVSAAYDYSDPSQWTGICKSGESQAPININKMKVVIDKKLHQLQAVNYNISRNGNYTVENNGLVLKLTPHITDTATYGHPNMVFKHMAYELSHIIFHWGRNSNEGSEHTVDNKKYPGEIHFVHFNKKYSGYNAAMSESDGLLIHGFIMEVDTKYNNTALDAIMGAMSNVMYKGNSTDITYTPPQQLFPKGWEGGYFHYKGSLTMPSCDESVMWFINQAAFHISEYQLQQFRMLYADTTGDKMITHNNRPVQDLKKREVKSIFVDNAFIWLTPSPWDHISTAIGASAWATHYPICNDQLASSRQSPINIVSADVKYNDDLKALALTSYTTTPAADNKMNLYNSGHGVSVSMKKDLFPAKITHKGLEYQLLQYHFHWGNDSSEASGSEHQYNGKPYFAEVHFVHVNTKYDSVTEAIRESDGLLVWGHFIQVKNGTDHAAFKKILDNFSHVAHKGKEHPIDYIPPMDLIPPNNKHYFTYPGSLTTPFCFESVTWIVNRDVITISIAQAEQFLSTYKNKEGYTNAAQLDNFRPVQAMNGRVVEKNFDAPLPSPSITLTSSVVLLFAALVVYFTTL